MDIVPEVVTVISWVDNAPEVETVFSNVDTFPEPGALIRDVDIAPESEALTGSVDTPPEAVALIFGVDMISDTKRSHLDPNQLEILFKISRREKEDSDHPDMMTSHRSPRYRACPSAFTPAMFCEDQGKEKLAALLPLSTYSSGWQNLVRDKEN
ncbi:hypothetical protein PAL_GLEAN10003714 [Pteropus alecto]|uniref:Uncharacterized protein n=1 Tax=Pteropus alecto TaxID=9402 RepID=L5KB97_PTEAL|nr:hypothetical protein PAL_GLEAN10003714 [Pteropus alecto]